MTPASKARNRRNHKLAVKRRTAPSQVRARKRRMRRTRLRGQR
jgi:hypothetical protein